MRISDWSSDVCSSDLKLAEVPVRAAPDDLAVAIKLGGGAARVGRLARSGNAEEILVMRGLPDPLHIATFVIVEVGAEEDIVGVAAVDLFGKLAGRWTFARLGMLARSAVAIIAQHLELVAAAGRAGSRSTQT